MTLEELGAVLLEVLKAVLGGIGEIFKCIGDIAIENASGASNPFPENSIKLFSNITLNRIAFFIILVYILFINIFTFCKFMADKKHAKRKEFRTSEKTLLTLCFAGGAAGGIIGMNTARHKTQKKKFTVTLTVLFILQLALYCFVLGFLGFWAFF